MKNILITGSSGFLGNHISFYLAKKNNVFTFDRKIKRRKEKNLKSFIYPKNIRDYVVFFKKNKIDIVIHNAGHFIKEHKTSDINKLIDIDIKKTLYLFEASKFANVKNIISFGSYYQFSGLNSKFNPANLYACTKQTIFTLAQHYLNNNKISHLQLILFDTYGKNDTRKKIINILLKIDNKKKLTINNPNAKMYPLYIEDVCRAVNHSIKYMFVKKKPFNKQFSIKSTKSIKVFELVNKISKLRKINLNNFINYKKKSIKNKIFIGKIIGLPFWKPKYEIAEGISKLK
jgi:nucleoside-diphosphate-sugar epimerase